MSKIYRNKKTKAIYRENQDPSFSPTSYIHNGYTRIYRITRMSRKISPMITGIGYKNKHKFEQVKFVCRLKKL